MPVLTVGSTEIPYEVRRSQRAGRMRIEVTGSGVEVVVPKATEAEAVAEFVARRRRWIFDRTREIQDRMKELRRRTPEGLHSGAKVLFRGRHLRLTVETGKVPAPVLTYRSAFHVTLPDALAEELRDSAVSGCLQDWMDDRLSEDAWQVVRRRGARHGLEPRGVRLKLLASIWGSCGKDGVLRLDQRLIRLPKPVTEYVIVHELCHLRHRDHSRDFWALVGRVMPDYEERKRWLEEHEVEVA